MKWKEIILKTIDGALIYNNRNVSKKYLENDVNSVGLFFVNNVNRMNNKTNQIVQV